MKYSDLDPIRLYRISRVYMQGYSNWYFFTHLPKAAWRYYSLALRGK